VGVFIIGCLVVVGGIVRHNHAGLAITEWRPITGIIPPLTHEEWQMEFDKYKQIPEYRNIHSHITLDDFKKLYLLEYIHRMVARLAAIYFIIPFIFFVIARVLHTFEIAVCIGLVLIGLMQGFIGWWMVKSGFTRPAFVSPFMLALHLFTAMIIGSGLMLLLRLDNIMRLHPVKYISSGRWVLFTGSILLILQTIMGALVSGTKAGYMYNTFPLMNGWFLPPDILSNQYDSIYEFLLTPSVVQFLHRVIAHLLLIWAIYVFITKQKNLYLMGVFISIQYSLGAINIVVGNMMITALMHQIMAFVVFMEMARNIFAIIPLVQYRMVLTKK